MLKGNLVYSHIDVERNRGYIDWLIQESEKNGIKLDLLILGKDKLTKSDFVINRSRSVAVANLYELNGIRTFNNARFTYLGNDKLAAYSYAKEHEVPFAQVLIEGIGMPTVTKANTGHGGASVRLHEEGIACYDEHIILQQYIGNLKGDARHYIVGNKVVHSVLRIPPKGSFVSNYSLGGEVLRHTPTKEEYDIIDKLLQDIYIDYGSIDLIITQQQEVLFNEFEDAVGSRMLSKLNINNTPMLQIQHIKANI